MEPGIKRAVSLIFEHRLKEGPFQVKMNIKPAYGGTGKDTSVWLPWKKWEFGNKKEPSKWITLLVKRIERRIHGWKKGK